MTNNDVWPCVHLGDVVDFRTGKLDSNQAVENGEYPFFTCSPETLRIDRYSFDMEAVLMAGNNANAIYPVKYYKGRFDAYQRTYIITPKNPDSLNCKYLYYQTQILSRLLTEYSLGTATKFLTMRILNNLEIPLPTIEEQRAIARILGALDDKIDLNRRMNRTLEAMAQAIFKSWFVDFDPVTAKSEGRLPYGMNAETTALFPAKFVDSELGPIPTGWRVGTVGEEFDLTMGQSPPGKTYNEIGEGIAFYQGRTDFGARYPTPRVYCTAPTRFANPGDTLVSVRAPVGNINMALEECSIGRGLASIRHKSGSRSYTYYSMQYLKEEFEVFEGEGTLFGSISGIGFRNIKVVLPPSEVIAEFERRIYPIDQSVENNERQSATLTAIRDALLPKLLSGAVRMNDLEKTL